MAWTPEQRHRSSRRGVVFITNRESSGPCGMVRTSDSRARGRHAATSNERRAHHVRMYMYNQSAARSGILGSSWANVEGDDYLGLLVWWMNVQHQDSDVSTRGSFTYNNELGLCYNLKSGCIVIFLLCTYYWIFVCMYSTLLLEKKTFDLRISL
jgi:hypothetical protein